VQTKEVGLELSGEDPSDSIRSENSSRSILSKWKIFLPGKASKLHSLLRLGVAAVKIETCQQVAWVEDLASNQIQNFVELR
jgi:hypothetical protein